MFIYEDIESRVVFVAGYLIPLLFGMLLFNAHLAFATSQVMIHFLR